MQKFFVDSKQIKEGKIEIVSEDVNHIVNVLRMQRGEELQICNKETKKNYLATIEQINKNFVECKIEKQINETTELNFILDIYQGIPKAEKMELIIQKLTEIGVTKFIPVKMERCVVKLQGKEETKKIERWNKIAEVAAKQSKRDCIPLVENLKTITEISKHIQEYDMFIVAYEEEKNVTIKSLLKEKREILLKGKIAVLIGPEGGISEKEIEQLTENGAKIVTLGKRILRTETAPIVIASDIVYELDL